MNSGNCLDSDLSSLFLFYAKNFCLFVCYNTCQIFEFPVNPYFLVI